MGISDLHMHSSASYDCFTSIWDMCERAAALGLEAVAFTEHVELNPEEFPETHLIITRPGKPGRRCRRRTAARLWCCLGRK